jgi:ketosteroid isomerase-like protein
VDCFDGHRRNSGDEAHIADEFACARRSKWVVDAESEESLVSKVESARAIFESYLTQDRDAADRLLADEFVFTSPQDDHIDKAAFLARCFPTADRLVSQEMLHVVQTKGDDVFVMYEYELKTGERHRNVELLTVRDDRITETQVFFGGRVR